MALPIQSHAQKSSPTACTVGPCLRVGVMANNGYATGTLASDEDHFITCGEGETVEVEVLATFLSGTSCRECDHSLPEMTGPESHPAVMAGRTWQWVVTGATSYTIVSDNATGINKRATTFALSGAGDTITIRAVVGNTDEGEFHEWRPGRMGEHGGSHDGAQAACTIKLWRIDLEANKALDPQLGYPYYTFEFAQNTATSATVIGGTSVEYRWRSTIGNSMHAEVTNSSNTWAGKIVASTGAKCRAKVVNGCDPTKYICPEPQIHLYPAIRRPGWTMDVTLTGIDDNWQEGNEDWFPGNLNMEFFAANTSASESYKQFSAVVVTPIYGTTNEFNSTDDYPGYENVPAYPAAFEDVIDQVESGPCINLWYDIDPDLYKVDNTVLVNYWVTPDADAPSTPALDPDGNPFINWLQLQADQFWDICFCSNPFGHGGHVYNIRYVSMRWHEKFGAPCPQTRSIWDIKPSLKMQS